MGLPIAALSSGRHLTALRPRLGRMVGSRLMTALIAQT
jgi:hypothetical protein